MFGKLIAFLWIWRCEWMLHLDDDYEIFKGFLKFKHFLNIDLEG
jgi:hypothetical protein